MIPFRGSYHSHSANGRKNIPSAIPALPPTAPAFNTPEAPYVPQEETTAPAVQTQPAKMSPAAVPSAMPAPEKTFQPTLPLPLTFTPSSMPSQEMNMPGSVSPASAVPQVPQTVPGQPVVPMMPQTPSMYMQPMYQNPMVQPSMIQNPMLQNACPYINSQMFFNTGDMDLMGMNGVEDMTIRVPNGDPPPVLSDNPVVPSISFFKELTGYPNYGNPSGNADILYTGNRGVWTMNIVPFLFVPGNQRAQLIIRAVLDDHYNTPARRYSLRITVNGTIVHNGPTSLEHGTPAGTRFNNWQSLTFNISNLRRNNRIVIENTSNTDPSDWIAFDWMELRLAQR